jgi:hypothetical protein
MANRRLRKELLETVRDAHAAGAIDVKKLEEFETFRVERVAAENKATSRRAKRRMPFRA